MPNDAVMQSQQTIKVFLESLASRAPTPGGGSGSALMGAVAAALSAMVGRLNDKKDGEAGPLHATIAEADALRGRLEMLIDEDIAAFNALAATWKLPDEGNTEVKQSAVVQATRTPLEIMEKALAVMQLAVKGLTTSKKNCISDAGVAGLAAHAALEGARLNVMINLPGIRDERVASELRGKADRVRAEGRKLQAEIEKRVDEIFK